MGADVIAVSACNSIVLDYACTLITEMNRLKYNPAVNLGTILNQIPDSSNSDLPVDVTTEIRELGLLPYTGLDDMPVALKSIAANR